MENKEEKKTSKKKKKPLTKISQKNNLSSKKGNKKLSGLNDGNKSKKISKNNLKNKK